LIEIKKIKEPSELAKYRNLSDASYRNMHGAPSGKIGSDGKEKDVYSIVLEHLIKEQGHLCAYCMKKIPEKRNQPPATIEHIKPQSETGEDLRLDYRNMLAVCSGNRNGANSRKTCDARRGAMPVEKQVLYINPLEVKTLRNIAYTSRGKIFSTDEKIDKNLNETLNLNGVETGLIDCRYQALASLQKEINARYPGRTVPQSYLKEVLNKLTNEKENKRPYVAILIHWLQKKIR
jgi:uncharacterized protein (TIGR02646 family)